MRSMIIAVDFDGTVVEDAYPRIGKPQLFAFETLKALHKERHRPQEGRAAKAKDGEAAAAVVAAAGPKGEGLELHKWR